MKTRKLKKLKCRLDENVSIKVVLMNYVQKIIKNIVITGISQFLISILGFLLLIYIARYLGEADFGKYNFALSFTALFVIISDLGISNLIIREVAREKKLAGEYIINASLTKSLLSFISFILIVLSINLMNYPQDVKIVVYLFGIYTILTSFALTFRSIFQAFEKMEYNAIVELTKQIMLIFFALYIIRSGYGLFELACSYLLTGILDIILSFLILYKQISRSGIQANFLFCRKLIVKSIPFGLNELFGVIFFKIDIIMLSSIQSDSAVGIYSAACVPLLSLSTIISYMVASTLYPVMSKYFLSSKKSLEEITVLTSKYMIIIGFPIGIGCLLLSDQFIELLYADQYSSSIIAFQILAFFIPFRLVSKITGTLLTSINKQNVRTISVGLSSLINIILNAILIPRFSFIGASVATVLSELILYYIFNMFIEKYYGRVKINSYFIKPCLASLLMGAFIIKYIYLNIFLLIPISAFVYFVFLSLLGTFSEDDIKLIKKIITKDNGYGVK